MASVRPSHFFLWLCLLPLPFYFSDAEAKCRVCKVALGNYYVNQNYNLTYISSLFDNEINYETLKNWNPDSFTNPNYIEARITIRIPFSCDCLGEGNNRYLGHMFQYIAAGGDTYDKIANTIYANLTTVSALQNVNSYTATFIPPGATLNVSINCSCGDASINKAYGLFLTYPLNAAIDNLAVLTKTSPVPADLLKKYNPTVDFTDASGIAFVPNQDPNGSYLPLHLSGGGIGPGKIAGISIGIAFALLLIAFGMFYIYVYKHKKAKKSALLHMTGHFNTNGIHEWKAWELGPSHLCLVPTERALLCLFGASQS